ncbi:alpha-D-ribose 1-methylphosphonate 5-triphosphate diphosphatase [Aliishimia ponticola]|uniref:Alpha-D-ribose 1-methylphosphonate 5-triphosphate diphosphatase n=1 Tax=Aliishimia ponticola TaxID=2499833 RepID=A0A4V3XKH7_9RHOB|nr:alpha-D-ribose 1-methylphosphonate 5-triphosphate diphosphatase [Aliishimia ponticola]THH36983.1 alpha-D-ribose 1-methylphosphonate 5-triphosphate diphosphatase [Aliishimia ponticola]
MLDVEFTGASVLRPDGLSEDPIAIAEGTVASKAARQVDLSGYRILPGIIDVHGDGFERHVAPRRGAMKDIGEGILAAEAEIAANGITTGVMAQFISWEGGLRGPEFGADVFCAIRDARTVTDLIPQARFETHLLDLYADFPAQLAAWKVPYVVFNDHLPHDRLAAGKTPKQMTGQALKAGRSPENHHTLLKQLHAASPQVPAALDALCARLGADGLRMGSHDDSTAEQRATWRKRGVQITEFPETVEAAEASDLIVLGAPNLVRGGSHKGNVSALDLVMMGLCDALASDYHYPSPRRAALFLARTMGLESAWKLVSEGPARVLGLTDRGQLAEGLRADLTILDADNRVAATISGGRVSYLTGDIANRLLAA